MTGRNSIACGQLFVPLAISTKPLRTRLTPQVPQEDVGNTDTRERRLSLKREPPDLDPLENTIGAESGMFIQKTGFALVRPERIGQRLGVCC
jgi:hypothetical protein